VLPLALDEKIVALHAALDAASIPHAFGGALALAYYAAPRGTHDIDVNVFVPEKRASRVLDTLTGIGVAAAGAAPLRAVRDRGQARVLWEHTPVDLFFSYDLLHDSCAERVRRVPFGEGVTLPILSAEDLAVFKVIFDRPKDWLDLGEMVYALGREFDATYARSWLDRILARDDERLARFEALLRAPHA
jgi:hypothetical protein